MTATLRKIVEEVKALGEEERRELKALLQALEPEPPQSHHRRSLRSQTGGQRHGQSADWHAPAHYTSSGDRSACVRNHPGGAPIMAALYLDSSALVKRYIQEVGSTWISRLMIS